MKILNFRNITNIVLIAAILGLSYLESDLLNANGNGLVILGIIDALVILLLLVNIFSRKTVVKEIEVVKEVYVNDENDDSQVFEMIEDNEERKSLVITSKGESQNLENYIENQLVNLSKEYDFAQAVFYVKDDNNSFNPVSYYAYYSDEEPTSIIEGDGIIGQSIKDKKMLSIDDIPEGYITILSGLGKGNPKSLLIVPALIDNNVIAVAEIASLSDFTKEDKYLIQESISEIAKNIINVID